MKSWEEVFKDILINPNSDATLLDEKVQESILKALREKSENLLELNFIEEKGVFGRMTQSTFKEYVWKNLIQCLKMEAVRKSAEDLLAGSGTDENKTIWSGFGVAELQGDDIRKYVNFEGDRGQKIKEALSKFLAKGKNKDKWEQFIKDIRRVGADDFADKIDLAFDDIRATAGMPRKTDEPPAKAFYDRWRKEFSKNLKDFIEKMTQFEKDDADPIAFPLDENDTPEIPDFETFIKACIFSEQSVQDYFQSLGQRLHAKNIDQFDLSKQYTLSASTEDLDNYILKAKGMQPELKELSDDEEEEEEEELHEQKAFK